jgi:hypothetical protein
VLLLRFAECLLRASTGVRASNVHIPGEDRCCRSRPSHTTASVRLVPVPPPGSSFQYSTRRAQPWRVPGTGPGLFWGNTAGADRRVTAGTCGAMFTASTMAAAFEALGPAGARTGVVLTAPHRSLRVFLARGLSASLMPCPTRLGMALPGSSSHPAVAPPDRLRNRVRVVGEPGQEPAHHGAHPVCQPTSGWPAHPLLVLQWLGVF